MKLLVLEAHDDSSRPAKATPIIDTIRMTVHVRRVRQAAHKAAPGATLVNDG